MNELCRQMDIYREVIDFIWKYRIQLNIDYREYLVFVLLKVMKEVEQGKDKYVILILIFSICNQIQKCFVCYGSFNQWMFDMLQYSNMYLNV